MVEPLGVKLEIILYFVCMLRYQFMVHAVASSYRIVALILWFCFCRTIRNMLNDSFIQNKKENTRARFAPIIHLFTFYNSYSIDRLGIFKVYRQNSNIFILEFVSYLRYLCSGVGTYDK